MTLTYAGLAVAASGLLLMLLAGPTYRLGLSLDAAFGLLRWAAYIGAAGLVLSLVAAWLAARRHHRLALGLAIAAAVAGLVAVVVPMTWEWRMRNAPPIHDISTDLENPPVFEAVVALRDETANPLDRPPMLAAQQREAYPDIAPATLALPVDRVFNRALDVAERQGWQIVASKPEAGIFEATDTSRWFGFTDDIVVRVTPWGSGTRVDVRSVSRVGRTDVGSNARRIRRFLDALSQE